MCGRVKLESDYSDLKIRLKFDADFPAPNFERDWNKPPTAPMLVAIRSEGGKRIPMMMKWGLLPKWSKDDKIGYSTFNARSEEFVNKPAFRDSWRLGHRCLVITDGFYEWKKSGPKEKQPYCIEMADGKPMVMAGLWSTWKSPLNGEIIPTCTVLTCSANNVMSELLDRMPCILGEADWAKWLGEEDALPEQLLDMLRSCPDEWLKLFMVDKKIGNVRNNSAQLALPI